MPSRNPEGRKGGEGGRHPLRDPWNSWYGSAHWRARRAAQLASEPLCRFCKANDRITAAAVVDHIVPHKGDWHSFAFGEVQSLCKACHDGEKSAIDRRGYSVRVDVNTGWPFDPNHPANGGGIRTWGYSIPDDLRPSSVPVVLVCGPPASGKTTYVAKRAQPGDVVIDLDDILESLGAQRWTNDKAALSRAIAIRNDRLRSLATTAGGTAYLIAGAPSQSEREAWRRALGNVTVVILRTAASTCIARIAADPNRNHAAEKLKQAVANWWNAFGCR